MKVLKKKKRNTDFKKRDEGFRAPNLLFCGYFMLKKNCDIFYFQSFINNVYLPI